jgi:hypothetical protein
VPAAPRRLSCAELRAILVDKKQGIGPRAAAWLDEPLGPGAPRLELLHLVLVSTSATADKRAALRAALFKRNKQDTHKAAGQAARCYLTERSAEALRAAESAALTAFLADPANVREFELPVHPVLAGRNPPNVKHRVTRHVYRTLRAFLPHASKLGLLRATEELIPRLTGKKQTPSWESIERALRKER